MFEIISFVALVVPVATFFVGWHLRGRHFIDEIREVEAWHREQGHRLDVRGRNGAVDIIKNTERDEWLYAANRLSFRAAKKGWWRRAAKVADLFRGLVEWLRPKRLVIVGAHVRIKGVPPTSYEYDEGVVLSMNGDESMVRWVLAKATYPEDTVTLEVIGGALRKKGAAS